MISVHLQGKPLNMIVYTPITNAEEAGVEGFYEDLQDLLELTPKEMSFSSSVQFGSVTQSCLTLCNPMDCSMPGFFVHHQLPELAQTHVHRVSDAIQPSHPLLPPSPPAIFPSIKVFSNKQTH